MKSYENGDKDIFTVRTTCTNKGEKGWMNLFKFYNISYQNLIYVPLSLLLLRILR